ncbi:hypothetical protein ACTFIV_011288, partial [Dictyostelium citrinum]
YQKQLII